MGLGRIPGSFGNRRQFGCVYYSGPIGSEIGLFDDFVHHTPGPYGVGADLATVAAGAGGPTVDPNQEELELLVRVYGSVKNRSASSSYSYWKKGKRQYRVDEYVADRDRFFGAGQAYAAYLVIARAELDADAAKLRRLIEPDPKTRKRHADWQRAQDVFYAWVRKAYQNQLGDAVDIPKLIWSQMSEKLKTALATVKADYGKQFKYGGFNPRPMKLDGYRLGTISEHGIGTAVDVESNKNAHISTAIWKAIQTFTGKTLTHASAQSKWQTAPKELHDSLKAINDEFVSRLAKAAKDAVESARKAAGAPDATKVAKERLLAVEKNPRAAAIEGDETLKKIGASFIGEWHDGFFDLPWDLVKEFHEAGFRWGATFEHPDLHHFEL